MPRYTLICLLLLALGAHAQPPIAISLDPDSRAADLLSQMTLDEKLQLLHGALKDYNLGPRGAAGYVPGIDRLGIPSLYLADGSVGVGNGAGQATQLPSSIASAATWDLDSAYRYGAVIGRQLRNFGLNVNLGGNVNLAGREPRNGRTFETKGEDPVLAGRITAAHLRAIQDNNVIAGLKHFALNDQESGRTTADVQIDERAARQSDLLAFEIALKESGVQSVMCSYNLVGGLWACENPWLLNQVLKQEWGFAGFVMSDWYATHSSVRAALAGLDQEQPGAYVFAGGWDIPLKSAVQNGDLPEARIDDMARRILRAMFASGLFDIPENIQPIDREGDEAIALETALQGSVLLRNNGILPLDANASQKIAIIGSHADIAVLSGGGSAQVTPSGGPALKFQAPCPPCWGGVVWTPSSPYQAIQAKAPNASLTYHDGADIPSAVELAAASDVVIVFASEWQSEGMDLVDLDLGGNQNDLIAAVSAANPRTIVVLESGGPQTLPWLDQTAALLAAWYPGQRGGDAIASLLFGEVNPSGKLPLTFPRSVEDLPHPVIADGDGKNPFPVVYDEGLLAGYKWFDAKGIEPQFPFGFGLSYTTFGFANQVVSTERLDSGALVVHVSFDLTNTGTVAGAEVAQVYLSLPGEAEDAPRRLVGFKKVYLEPGETQTITLDINELEASHPFSYWTAEGWKTPDGDYTVFVGNSSGAAGLLLSSTFHLGA